MDQKDSSILQDILAERDTAHTFMSSGYFWAGCLDAL